MGKLIWHAELGGKTLDSLKYCYVLSDGVTAVGTDTCRDYPPLDNRNAMKGGSKIEMKCSHAKRNPGN